MSPPTAVYFRSLAEYTVLGVLRDTIPQSFSADFHSFLVARSIKPIKCVLKTLLRKSTHAAPIRPQKAKQTVCPAVPNNNTLVDSSVTFYQICINQGSPNILGEDHIS